MRSRGGGGAVGSAPDETEDSYGARGARASTSPCSGNTETSASSASIDASTAALTTASITEDPREGVAEVTTRPRVCSVFSSSTPRESRESSRAKPRGTEEGLSIARSSRWSDSSGSDSRLRSGPSGRNPGSGSAAIVAGFRLGDGTASGGARGGTGRADARARGVGEHLPERPIFRIGCAEEWKQFGNRRKLNGPREPRHVSKRTRR